MIARLEGTRQGCSRRYSEVAPRYASVASTSQPAENDFGANRLSYGTFLAVTDGRCAFRVSCGRASIRIVTNESNANYGQPSFNAALAYAPLMMQFGFPVRLLRLA